MLHSVSFSHLHVITLIRNLPKATDSVFQLNNLNVGGEVGSVESGILAIFAAEDVFQPTNPTSLSCTSGISVIVFLESKHTIFLNVRRIIFLCY